MPANLYPPPRNTTNMKLSVDNDQQHRPLSSSSSSAVSPASTSASLDHEIPVNEGPIDLLSPGPRQRTLSGGAIQLQEESHAVDQPLLNSQSNSPRMDGSAFNHHYQGDADWNVHQQRGGQGHREKWKSWYASGKDWLDNNTGLLLIAASQLFFAT